MADIRLTEGDDVYIQPLAEKENWRNYYGLGGNDTFKLYSGVAVGGKGNDTIDRLAVPNEPWWEPAAAYWDSPAGIRADLTTGKVEDGWGTVDTLIGINQLHGNGFDDWFKGNDNDNYFWGNGGTDTVFGGGGIDGVGMPWFQPVPGQDWRQALLSDLKVEVSPDGKTATISPAVGSGFTYKLTDVEFFEAPLKDGENWQRFYLSDFITQTSMAEQAVAAGGALRWNSSSALGTAANITFSFVTAAPASGVGATGFAAFTEAQKQVVRKILADSAKLAGLTFTEVTEAGSTVGQIRFGVSQQADTKGVSWLPNQPNAGELAGDVWMDVESMLNLTPGSEGYAALLHEIGHSLGLRHPRNEDAGDTWAMQLRAQDDRQNLSVMAANEASKEVLYRTDWGPLDVLALRYLYGMRAVNTGDTVYKLGEKEANGLTTITDDGGLNTIDASAYQFGVKLDLRPGSLSSVGVTPAGVIGVDNLAIGGTTWIHNAVGTDFDDVLTGNDLDNTLTGRLGNNWIEGGKGFDTTVFGGKATDYLLSFAFGKVFVEALDGVSGFNTLIDVEALSFTDATVPTNALSIVGTPWMGNTLNVVNLLENKALDATVAWQWLADGVAIAGATSASLPLKAAQAGKTISLTATYTTTQNSQVTVTAQLATKVGGDGTPPVLMQFVPAKVAGAVTLAGSLAFEFNEPVVMGTGKIVIRDEAGKVFATYDMSNSDQVSIVWNTLTLKHTALFDIYTKYRVEFSNDAVLDASGNAFAGGSHWTFKTQTLDGLYHFFVVAFNAAPGKVYMGQLAEAYNYGLSLQEIVEIFTTKTQFTDTYAVSLSNRDLAAALVGNIVKNSASEATKLEAINDIAGALDFGWSRGKMIYTVFGNLANKPLSDPVWGSTAKQFQNELAVARYYTETLDKGGEDLNVLRSLIANVDQNTDVSTEAAIAKLIGVIT